MTLKQLNQKYCCFADKLKTNFVKEKCSEKITPLSQNCKRGRKKICKITGDRNLCARMATLGVYPGKEIELICPENGSQCLLKIHGGTISLDSNTSKNILVQSL